MPDMDNITYRPIRTTDFDALHTIVSDWNVTRQLGGWPWPPNPEFTKSRCKPYEGEGFVWAICDDDRLIGTLGVTNRSIGYQLSPTHHRRGITKAAATYAINRGFDELGHDTIVATTWHDNAASHGLLTGLGFAQYQLIYERGAARNYPTLARHYRLPRARWDRLRNPAQ